MLSALGFAYILALGFEYGRTLVQRCSPIFRNLVMAVFWIILGINLLYFGYDYFLRRPISVGEQFNANEKSLVDYMQQYNKPLTIYHKYPYEPYMSYVFLNNSINFSEVQKTLAYKTKFAINGYSFATCIPYKNLLIVNHAVIYEGCLKEEEHRTFAIKRKVLKTIPYQDYTKKIVYFFVE